MTQITLENLLNGAKSLAATSAAYAIITVPAFSQEAVRYQDGLSYRHEVVEYQGAKQKPAARLAAKKHVSGHAHMSAQNSETKTREKKTSSRFSSVLSTIGNVVLTPFRHISEGAYGMSHTLPYGSNAPKKAVKSYEQKDSSRAAPKSDFDNLPPEIQAALRAGSNVKVDTETIRYERKFSAQLYTQNGKTYGPMTITVNSTAIPTNGKQESTTPGYTEKVEILPDGTRVTTRSTSSSAATSSTSTNYRPSSTNNLADVVRKHDDKKDSTSSGFEFSFNYAGVDYPNSLIVVPKNKDDIALVLGNKKNGRLVFYGKSSDQKVPDEAFEINCEKIGVEKALQLASEFTKAFGSPEKSYEVFKPYRISPEKVRPIYDAVANSLCNDLRIK